PPPADSPDHRPAVGPPHPHPRPRPVNPFGPLLRFELVRIARRQRLTLARCLYALTASAIAAAVYTSAFYTYHRQPRPQDLARVTEGLFYGLFALQFFAALSLAPRWTAATIAGEKE